MSATVITKVGDVLDKLCWAQYPERLATLNPVLALQFEQRKAGITDLVLSANPHLADYGPVLPAGVTIVFPDLPQQTTLNDDVVRFWTS